MSSSKWQPSSRTQTLPTSNNEHPGCRKVPSFSEKRKGSEAMGSFLLSASALLNLALLSLCVYLGSTSMHESKSRDRTDVVNALSAIEGGSSDVCFKQQVRRAEEVFQRHAERRMRAASNSTEEIGFPLPENLKSKLWAVYGQWSATGLLEYSLLPRYPCFELERIGNWGEGGKWLCMQSLHREKGYVVYSIGCNGETSFEQDIHAILGAKPHTYDPTLLPHVKKEMAEKPFLHFHDMGLTGDPNLSVMETAKGVIPVTHVTKIIEELHHQFIDVFKIDCEGCEFGFVENLPKIMSREKPLFGQILMEIHGANELERSPNLLRTMRNMGYRMFHLETNFFAPSNVFEVAFIHESLVKPE